MTMIDEDLTLYCIREAQLILANYLQPSSRDAAKTIEELLTVLDQDDVVEAVDRRETQTGPRMID